MNDKLYQDFDRALELIGQLGDEFLELAALLRQLQEKEPDDFKALLSNPELGRRKGYYWSKSTVRSPTWALPLSALPGSAGRKCNSSLATSPRKTWRRC